MGSMRSAAHWVAVKERFWGFLVFSSFGICLFVQYKMFQGDCVGFTDNLLETQHIAGPLKDPGPVGSSYHKRGLLKGKGEKRVKDIKTILIFMDSHISPSIIISPYLQLDSFLVLFTNIQRI